MQATTVVRRVLALDWKDTQEALSCSAGVTRIGSEFTDIRLV